MREGSVREREQKEYSDPEVLKDNARTSFLRREVAGKGGQRKVAGGSCSKQGRASEGSYLQTEMCSGGNLGVLN